MNEIFFLNAEKTGAGFFFHNNNKEKKIGILKRISAKMSITIIAKIPYHSFPSWMYQSGEYPKISKSTLYF